MTALRTMEQGRAADAWARVDSARAIGDRYLNVARRAATDVQVNGLGQTLAFWKAKGTEEHGALYRHLSAWVMRQMDREGDLLKWLISPGTGGDSYRRATMEAIAYLGWIKRFAEAEFGGKERGRGAENG